MHIKAFTDYLPRARMGTAPVAVAVFVAVVAAVGTLSTTAHAADADLDPAWGVGGKQWFQLYSLSSSVGHAVAVQPDGKIVVAGASYNGSDFDFAVARLISDGTALDLTFSGDGKAFFDFVWGDDYASEVLIQPDGKIILAGEAMGPSGRMFGVVRFNPGGSLDDYWFVQFPGEATAHGAALQPDGKIVLVGKAYNPSDSWDFAVARFTADLDLDTSFAGSGIFTWDWGDSAYDCAYEVAIAGDGRIVAAGTGSFSGQNQIIVMWFTSTGGISGAGVSNFPDPTYGYGLALQPDDKPVIVGKTETYGGIVAIARFLTNGLLDTSFSTDGMASFNFSTGVAMDVGIQEDGKIVFGGYITESGYDNFLIVRHLQDNGLDYSFTATSEAHTTYRMLPNEHARGHALALQPDGKILVTGYTGSGASQRLAVTRHLGDETLIFADDFESGSTAWWSTTVP